VAHTLTIDQVSATTSAHIFIRHGNERLIELPKGFVVSVTFPFCLVMARHGHITLPVAPAAGYIAGFSTIEKAAAYMFQRGETDWRMTLVSRPTFDATVESLRLIGVKGSAFNPAEGPGELLDLDEISRF